MMWLHTLSLLTTILLFAVGQSVGNNHILNNIEQNKDKQSAKCIHKNLLLSKQTKCRILILRQNQSATEEFLLHRMYKNQLVTINIVNQTEIAAKTNIRYMPPIQIVWFINQFTDYYDIEKMAKLFQFATKIHLIYFQNIFTMENELERITRAYFGLFDEQFLSRVRFHVIKNMGIDENHLWRVYKRGRASRRAIDKQSECRFNSKFTKFVQFREKTICAQSPCPLRILARKYEPYTHFNEENWFFNGMEIQLMQTIAKQLGAKATYALDTSRTGATYIGPIDNREIDMIIGGFGNISNEQSAFISIGPYFQDDATWCVAHAKSQPPWINLFIIFQDLRVVALNVITVLLGAFLTFCFTLKRYIGRDMCITESFLIFFQMAVCNPANHRARTTLVRVLTAILLIMIFFHYQAMTSCYINIIAFRIDGFQMKTQTDLINADWNLAGDMDSYKWLSMDYRVRLPY